MTPLAAYLLLFVAVGAGFILVHLLLGKLIRPDRPDAEKDTIYECGEPTIGSAWVQFDVRYYVVALLFVIFDVEVAFFFPWAEVFGKANAVANLKEPTDAAGYNQAARAVFDLSGGGGTSSGADALERRKWEALAALTPEALVAYRGLQSKEDQLRAFGGRLAELRGLPDGAFDAMKAEADKLAPVLKKVAREREAAATRTREAVAMRIKDPWVQALTAEKEEELLATPLGQLKALPKLLAGAIIGPMVMARPRLEKQFPAEVKAMDAEGARTQAELSAAVNQAEEALAKAFTSGQPGPAAATLPGRLSVEAMQLFGAFDRDQRAAVSSGRVTADLFRAMDTSNPARALLPHARRQARDLARLALVEVLVFFGVLLVGFAYLWRRGDIEWVRSTAAEKEALAPARDVAPTNERTLTGA